MKELEFQDIIWEKREYWGNFFEDIKSDEIKFDSKDHKKLLINYTINRVNKKLSVIHDQVRSGRLTDKERNYRTSDNKLLKVDFIGQSNDEEFVVEIKTNKNAERNSATELNAYTKALTRNEPLLNPDQTLSVNITNFHSGISKESYLKEIIYTDKKTIAYNYIYENNKIHLSPVLLTENDIPEHHIKFQQHTVNCFKVTFQKINGTIQEAPEGGLLDSHSKLHYAQFCSNLLADLKYKGHHGCIIGKTLWDENRYILKDNEGNRYKKDGNEIYIYLINPYICPVRIEKYSIGKKQQLIEEFLNKYFISNFHISLVTSPSNSNTFWNDQHIFFQSFGMLDELCLAWSKTESARDQFDELNYSINNYSIIKSVEIFTAFLEDIDYYFL